jgi:hypothetical protein
MTTNSGSEPSKVPGMTTGSLRKAMGRHKKEIATNKERIKILDWYHKNGKINHSWPSTLTKFILTSISNSPWYPPGSKMKQQGGQHTRWRMVWLTQPNELA